MLAERRVLKSQDTVVSDHVSPVISDHVSPVNSDHVSPTTTVTAPVAAVAPGPILNKQQQRSQPIKTLKKQPVVTTVNTHPPSLNQQHTHKPPTIVKQPPTKPLPLLGMEHRAHMMAERRQARVERQKQREEQLLVSQHLSYALLVCKYVNDHCVQPSVPS